MPSYGTTLTIGVQDIAALLPLLGTEQTEVHVASAISDGYLFAAAAPLSLFGTFGLAVAGFKAFISSLVGYFGFFGAELLKNAGFGPSGKSLELIMMNSESEHPNRYLIETRIEEFMEQFGVGDADKGKVSDHIRFDPPGMVRWALGLVFFTGFFSAINFTAYLDFSLREDNELPRSLCILFPLVRLCGAFLVTVSLQFLVLIRLPFIIGSRIKFWSVDKDVKRIFLSGGLKQADLIWDGELSSEKCLWSLNKLIRRSLLKRSGLLPSSTSYKSSDSESGGIQPSEADLKLLKKRLDEPLIYDNILLRPFGWFLRFSLLLGITGCLTGYLGCFSVVQGVPAESSRRGPFIWLGIESSLSLVRLILWSLDPKWDNVPSLRIYYGQNYKERAGAIPAQNAVDTKNKGLALTSAPTFLNFLKQNSADLVKDFDFPDVSVLYAMTEISGGRSLHIVVYDHLRNAAFICSRDQASGQFVYKKATLMFGDGLRAVVGIDIPVEEIGGSGKTPHQLAGRDGLKIALQDHFSAIDRSVQALLDVYGEHSEFVECDWSSQLTKPS